MAESSDRPNGAPHALAALAAGAPRAVAAAVLSYLVLLWALRVALFPGASQDDAEQMLLSQAWAWGYDLANPPLFTWLVIAVERLVGISVAAVEGVKFAALAATYLLIYATGRQVLRDDRLAMLSALSLLAIYYVAWDAVLSYSHSVLLTTACAATFLALLRLDRAPALSSYALLGLCLGLGGLTKYNFALVATALAIAAMTDADLRRRLLDPRIALTVAIAAAIAAPHGIWLLDRLGGAGALVSERLYAGEQASHLVRVGHGLFDVTQSTIGFLSPLWILLLLFFPRAYRPLKDGDRETARYHRVLTVYLCAIVGLIVVIVMAVGATRVRTSYMFVLILFPVFFFARVQAIAAGPAALRRFGLAMAALAALVPAGLVAKDVIDPSRCRKCYLHVPYGEIADALRAAGFETGTIFAWLHRHYIGGNLRPHFPAARIVGMKHRGFVPPATGDSGQCLLIWDADQPSDPAAIKASVVGEAARLFGAEIDESATVHEIMRPIGDSAERRINLRYILVKDGSGGCR